MKTEHMLKCSIVSFFFFLLFSIAAKNSNSNHIRSNNGNYNSFLLSAGTKLKLKAQVNTFIDYLDKYSQIKISDEHLQTIKYKSQINSQTKKVDPDKIFVYYNQQNSEITFESKEVDSKEYPLIALGIYDRTRFQIGWDKLNIHTFSTANPLIQCYTAGYIEGVMTSDEIFDYYQNIHVFFYGRENYIADIKNFYDKIDKNLKEKISLANFKNLRDSIDDDSNGGKFKHWSYITCLHAQLHGLHHGYNRIADKEKKLDILDFYFINSEGNFGDLRTFIEINKMKIDDTEKFYTKDNLLKIYNTENIEQIWKTLIRQGHCSAVIKIIDPKKTQDGLMDIIAGHDTWTDYCEMLRTLKYIEFDFEGDDETIGMAPKKINFSSYPGVLFSGDDFYEIDSKVVVLQTTLTSLNRFCYRNLLNMDEYIPEFMRIMITNFISSSAKEWVDNYQSYKNHMYITQWLVIDYNVLDKINNERNFLESTSNRSGLIYLVEEVPGSIKSKDISEITLSQGYFGSFNLAYFPEHLEILGITHFTETGINFDGKQYNPRNYIVKHLHNDVKDINDFQKLMAYNGYKNPQASFPDDPSLEDPTNGISARNDLASFQSFNGGVDYKIVNRQLVQTMTILANGGPSYGTNPNLPPFNFDTISEAYSKYHQGIPKLWNFSPFYFSKKDFSQ